MSESERVIFKKRKKRKGADGQAVAALKASSQQSMADQDDDTAIVKNASMEERRKKALMGNSTSDGKSGPSAKDRNAASSIKQHDGFAASRTAGASGRTESSMATARDDDEEADRELGLLRKQPSEILAGDEAEHAEGITLYTGMKNRKTYATDNEKEKPKASRIGPQRASSFVRVTSRFDYAPDICKDWKETGFCGYGDNCKFMHDRGDYKSGWELEKEWEEEQKRLREGGAATDDGGDKGEYYIGSDDEEDDDGLPHACFICRGPFVSPVVTNCGHYFCEKCALKRFRKKKDCAACGAATNGIFNTAKKIVEKLKKKKLDEGNEEPGE